MPRDSFAIAVGSVLITLATQAVAQSQEDCKSDIVPSSALLIQIDRAAAHYKGSEALSPKNRLAANKRWTCSRDKEDLCCHNIPLTLLLDEKGTACAVAFPYGELAIKRDKGRFKPKLSWLVAQSTSPAAYVFGSDGIEITLSGSAAPPVDTSGSDKCRYDGPADHFRCRGNGKKNATAGHVANVFPIGHLDDPAFRCGNIDPTISNTN